MIVKSTCPSCNETLTVKFITNGTTGVQNEEHHLCCHNCGKNITVSLKEVCVRIETYIHSRL